jgi:AAA domain, putative AbiEii toxin, Type IV TA system
VVTEIEALGLKESDVFTIKLNKHPIIKKRSELLAIQSRYERELNVVEKGSMAANYAKLEVELKAIQDQLDAPHKAYEAYLSRKTAWEKIKARIVGSVDTPESIQFYKEELKKLDAVPEEIVAQRSAAVEKSRDIFREKALLAEVYRALYKPVQKFIDSNAVAKNELQLLFKVEISDTGFADTFFTHVSQGVRGTYCGAEDGRKRLNKLLADSDLTNENGIVTFVQKLIQSLLIDERDEKTPTNIKDVVRKGQTSQSLYDFIYGLDYLRPRYSLGISGKSLSELSPGERGALLLVFYLLVDQNDSPLVIDQPEENLDNQTVFKLLVPCIKEAKKRRQIIVITHNPNLAVVCDAEQIICCSIDKHDGNRLSYQAGAIENPVINKAIVDILEGTRPAFDNRGSKYLESSKR